MAVFDLRGISARNSGILRIIVDICVVKTSVRLSDMLSCRCRFACFFGIYDSIYFLYIILIVYIYIYNIGGNDYKYLIVYIII